MATRFKRDWPRPEGWTGAWTPDGPVEVMDPEAIMGSIADAAYLKRTMQKDMDGALKEAATLGLTELPPADDEDAWEKIAELYLRRDYPQYYEDLADQKEK